MKTLLSCVLTLACGSTLFIAGCGNADTMNPAPATTPTPTATATGTEGAGNMGTGTPSDTTAVSSDTGSSTGTEGGVNVQEPAKP